VHADVRCSRDHQEEEEEEKRGEERDRMGEDYGHEAHKVDKMSALK